jgi:hypothetical protein
VESEAIAFWRRALAVGPYGAWVVFDHGTCVVFREQQEDAAAKAKVLLAEWGPVYPGSPSGDFSVGSISGVPEHIVTCHHPDILNYVAEGEVAGALAEKWYDPDVVIGVAGRAKRRQDAKELRVIHVEQGNRGQARTD